MIFQLTGCGWPIEGGAKLVPVNTILDRASWQWNGVDLPWPPPINAVALDQAAYDELLLHYPANRILTANPEIVRTGDL
jgi:hypothetical protein